MDNLSFNPLHDYKSIYRGKFKQLAESTFAEIASEAQVDLQANRATCKKVYENENSLSTIVSRTKRWKFLKTLLWIVSVICLIKVVFNLSSIATDYLLVIYMCAACASLVFIFAVVRPVIKRLSSEDQILSERIASLKNEAMEQMRPLNRLYDWDILTRLISQTLPWIHFDPYFSTVRLDELKNDYGLEASLYEENSSILYAHSGTINGNPFVVCRTKEIRMVNKKYEGSARHDVVDFSYQDKNGWHSHSNKEILYGAYIAQCPEYFETTRLIYGCVAAPELSFKRDKSTSITRKLMGNKFEKVFGVNECNDREQYDRLFSRLAQERLLELLKDKETGWGDDFTFEKKNKVTTIVSDHLQSVKLDMDPAQYHCFDFEKAKKNFCESTELCFKAVYFALAPLFCIPAYQETGSSHSHSDGLSTKSSSWEHESLANFLLPDKFKHPECVTDCLLKTEQLDSSTIKVSAYGFKIEKRITETSVVASNKKLYPVPVKWDEYIPVAGSGTISICEDVFKEDLSTTYNQRSSRIEDMLNQTGASVYRRHIAAKV